MKSFGKSVWILLLVAAAFSPARAGVGLSHRKNNNNNNNDVAAPRCDKFYGYTLTAWLGYEIRHPRVPDPLRKHREITVCLREN